MANVSSQQKKILDTSVSVARALSGESNLNYRGTRLYKGDIPFYFLGAHINDLTFVSRHDLANNKLAMQGKVDSSALRLIYSDSKLHRNWRPDTEVARLLYDFCEQIRIESFTPPHYMGVRRSIEFNFQYWSEQYQQNGFTESRLGLLLFTVMQVIHSRLTGIAVSDSIAEAIESTRAGIVPSLGHYLVALKRHRYDQTSFAKHAVNLSVFVQELVEQEQSSDSSESPPPVEEDIKILAQLALIVDGDIEERDVDSDITGHSRAFELAGSNYRIFSRDFDEVVNADSLVRTALLSELRQKITDDILSRQINTKLLAAQLIAIVGTLSHSKKEQYLEEGTVDAHALTKVITSPMERTVFYQPKIGIALIVPSALLWTAQGRCKSTAIK
ncbi:aerobic cobaltochelatase CobT subunit [Vibrio maritimus]|uniref:Aerobic cobaltochelatase CobT subunit n=1 Tax=Vibrio maritimus TaxID=990268 RepID=A0A090STN3_9VIBR|nr:aerobic cobaltochelatase CobT subunit [Vibrio maritimus]